MQLYGILIAFALAVAAFLCTQEEKRLALPKDTGLDIVLYALPPAIIFARLYYVVFSWDTFKNQPLDILKFWEGGLAIYGGVIGGALGVWLLSRKRQIPILLLGDIVAPPLLLGQAIGRWGNYFNGEAFGTIVNKTAWQFFPFAVKIGENWHLATFFYESMWNLLGFLFLYLNRKRLKVEGKYGHVLYWYFIWYGLGRLMIEGMRTDSLMWGSIRVSQLLSLLIVALALVKLIADLKAKYTLVLFPVIALAVPFIIPGWYGMGLSFVLLSFLSILLYRYYPKQAGFVT